MRLPAPVAAGCVAATLVALTAGCGGRGTSSASEAGGSTAADTSTCVAQATQVSDFPAGYPADFPLPTGIVVYHVEDRGTEGVVATGVTRTPFAGVLAALNAAKSAGFEVTEGETEEHDAEANWTGHGYTGRWAIRESSSCPGETVLQLLSKKT